MEQTNGIKILVGCEESQAVTKAFRKLGFEAYSCDLLPCSGEKPEWHFQTDVFKVIDGGIIETQSGDSVSITNWDMAIFHPTCTYLTNSGVCWLWNKDGSKNEERWDNLRQGGMFFKQLLHSKIPLMALENPIPHKYAVDIIGVKYDQLIQPYHFGHAESKATCFWLKGLPKLEPTNDVKHIWKELPKNEAQRLHYLPPSPDRAKLRSKTFTGIAEAMAKQWGDYILKNN